MSLHLASEHFAAGRIQAAESICRRLVGDSDCGPSAIHLLATICAKTDRLGESAELLKQVVTLRPDDARYQNDLGVALEAIENFEDAERCYRAALAKQPNGYRVRVNLANTLLHKGDLAGARHECVRAVRDNRAYAPAHNALGCISVEEGDLAAAYESFQRAMQLDERFAEARANLGRTLLTLGQFKDGWRHFSYLSPGGVLRHLGKPWDGSENIRGKTILLYAEGGLGNIIHFARYAKLVKDRGARVVIEGPPALNRLLATIPGVDQVAGDDKSTFTFHTFVALMDLPRIFGTTLETVPADVPYISADQGLIEYWKQHLRDVPGFKVGVVWQAEQSTAYGRKRSVPFGHLATLAQVPGIQLISLQKGWNGSAAFPLQVLPDLDGKNGPFMDTAAVMKNLDLVISADTSAVHLAGALGVPVWVAERFSPDWRWMMDREDSPWYPTVRLFRQSTRDVWRDVFERMATELAKLTKRAKP